MNLISMMRDVVIIILKKKQYSDEDYHKMLTNNFMVK